MHQIFETLMSALAGLDPAGYLALVTVVAALSQWLAWRLKVPSILLLLVVGFGLGQIVSPDDVLGRDVLFGGVKLAVGVILFEGSMTLRIRDVRDLGTPVRRMSTVTVVIAWALITLSGLLVGLPLELALLIGAMLVVTGPTVIAPILRMLRPTKRVASMLRWEGIVVDPIGAVLAVLVFQGVMLGRGGDTVPQLIGSLLLTILVAFGLGLGLGWGLEQLVKRHALPEFLHGVVFISVAVGALVISDKVQPESGLLAVTVLGIYLANRPNLHLRNVQEFSEHLQVLFVGALFVVLAGRISPSAVATVAPQGLLFVLLLVVIVRPASIFLSLLRTKVTRQEKLLLAFVAPRGIVAAAVTSVFGLEFQRAASLAAEQARDADPAEAQQLLARADNLAELASQAENLVPLVFLVIVCTVAIYGLGVGRLAERLGLASASPQGVMFVGGSQWLVDAAKLLHDDRVLIRVVSRKYHKLAAARRAGLYTVTANILSEYAVKDMDLAGIRTLIAATPDNEVNAAAAREFTPALDRANVFQLARHDDTAGAGPARGQTAPHLNARTCFDPPRGYGEMQELMDKGYRVKRTKLTKAFTLDDFRNHWGPDAVVMFVLNNGDVSVAVPGGKIRKEGVTLIAMVPPEPAA